MNFSIMVIVGTRPEIIKMAPIIREIEIDKHLNLIFIHSGQHYDYELSQKFIEELELPSPNTNLTTGSGTHAEQTSNMLQNFELQILEHNPHIVLAEGDTNTVLAAGLASVKLHVPFGHVEAGIRSFDRTMPEEINRRIAAVCAELHFAPTERAAIYLVNEGISPDKIFITGNTIVDACLQHIKIAKNKSRIIEKLGLSKDQVFATVTVHRPENVDNIKSLKKIVQILLSINNCILVFPIHPRTKKRLIKFNLLKELENADNLFLSEPLGYLDFLRLLSESAFVLTDSGGIQEEALTLRTPCITLRDNTERYETLEVGANSLVGLDKELTLKTIDNILNKNKYDFNSYKNPYGDGKTGKRIVQIIKSACLKGIKVPSYSFIRNSNVDYNLLEIQGKLAGKSIKQISEEIKKTICLIYDLDGRCIFPKQSMKSIRGWKLLTFG